MAGRLSFSASPVSFLSFFSSCVLSNIDICSARRFIFATVSPFFSFKESREGKLGYGFSSQGDNGAGAKSKNLILFDMAILELTALPFVIHDSTVIKQIAYLPVVKMLELYEKTAKLYDRCGDPKQVFFAFDASPAYGQEAVELSDELRVIHLDDGTKALYGYTWNTKKNKKNSEKPQ